MTHGDVLLYNLMLSLKALKVVAVIDWEQSSLFPLEFQQLCHARAARLAAQKLSHCSNVFVFATIEVRGHVAETTSCASSSFFEYQPLQTAQFDVGGPIACILTNGVCRSDRAERSIQCTVRLEQW